jgi:hypothetical protein
MYYFKRSIPAIVINIVLPLVTGAIISMFFMEDLTLFAISYKALISLAFSRFIEINIIALGCVLAAILNLVFTITVASTNNTRIIKRKQYWMFFIVNILFMSIGIIMPILLYGNDINVTIVTAITFLINYPINFIVSSIVLPNGLKVYYKF